ncbi:NAD(P)/FAD-dependent oxidoreductase [Negadavirga shengliensis]|uniref:NAD(P)/FAD-dependent oxidoreductase n=1 Tax=Negadavirga shengliensis TaxID=1389218 RepID=A0ABV9T3U2_9BACT
MEVDFLLIGQGLAGSVLSYRLLEAGLKVHLIDRDEDNTSSKVAAGLYNPVTGRKMVKTWQVDTLFSELEPFYKKIEKVIGEKILHPVAIYRPFLSVEEQNEWMAKSADPQYAPFVREIATRSRYRGLNDPYGGVALARSGYLDIPVFLSKYAGWLEKQGAITRGEFVEDDLKITGRTMAYHGIKAKGIVYTNGLGASESRYFKWLPFAPVKGEVLTIAQDFEAREIINRGVFRIDLGKGVAKVGSNYEKGELTVVPTEKARKEILGKLNELFNIPVKRILGQKAGIRPATIDRRPFLGKHPEYKNVYVFSGLGTKGVSLAPYFSEEMINLLILNKEPQKEVNINRFFKYI